MTRVVTSVLIYFLIIPLFFSIVLCHKIYAKPQILATAENYITKTNTQRSKYLIIVNTKSQQMSVFYKNRQISKYLVSTGKSGIGQIIGSRKTPLGLHVISDKIGANAPKYAIFKGKKFTGKIWNKSIANTRKHTRDYMVTRLLILKGLEPGLNKGVNHKSQLVDSFRRYIYIHGTTMEHRLGRPSGNGCIHLGTKQIIQLYQQVPVGTQVLII